LKSKIEQFEEKYRHWIGREQYYKETIQKSNENLESSQATINILQVELDQFRNSNSSNYLEENKKLKRQLDDQTIKFQEEKLKDKSKIAKLELSVRQFYSDIQQIQKQKNSSSKLL